MRNYIILAGILILLFLSSAVYSLNNEKDSPFNHIPENQIKVYNDKIVLTIENAHWAKFADTNSMDPVFDIEANTIEIKPSLPEQVHIGDIVSYNSELLDNIIIHRVVNISSDEIGWYATFKGDNNLFNDPEKVRFGQINGLIVAIIY
ncbi:hypothetical protein J4418_01420 [Candidatus Woesearchaeota archaeon]|nr:hypothetical protein [Candidatus Woesearchaeota archaeon]